MTPTTLPSLSTNGPPLFPLEILFVINISAEFELITFPNETDPSYPSALPNEDPMKAVIVKWDEENDIAVIASTMELPALGLSENPTWPGYWVMALGSADGYEGSVSFGNVINSNSAEILITNNVSSGNSGGPLVDNEGKVVGVITWAFGEEQYNGAKSLDAFCSKILKCEYDGGKTWWDYSGD